MRSFAPVILALFVAVAPSAAFSQAEADLKWKTALMAGDDQIEAFDNATRSVKELLLRMGVEPANIRELSISPGAQSRGALLSSADNLELALRQMSVGKGDGCLVYMTSHGSRQAFYVKDGIGISPARLNTALERGCGDQPTVLLVSACYSGIFLDRSMLRPNRIILSAAAADRTSFGCSAENQYTYWDGCLINSLSRADAWRALYGEIRGCVELKETSNRFTPSLPLAYFGDAVANLKLPGAAPVDPDGGAQAIVNRCATAKDVTYGMSPQNPVKVGFDGATGPERQLQYLNAMRGASGQVVRYRRVGTASASGVILDVYELRYDGLPQPVKVYLDSYHFEEPAALPGFICPYAINLAPR